MSRSYKKHPIVKDKGINDYNKRIRRITNNKITTYINKNIDVTDLTYPNQKELIQEYDICDWIWRARNKKEEIKYKRK